jgi:PAS domain S-box-containing protein
LEIREQMFVDVAAHWYKVEFPSVKRRDATGCPLSALGIASGREPPFPTRCEMTTKSEMKRTVGLAFGAAILVLLAVGVLAYRGTVVSAESDRWVRHTHEVLENTQNLDAAVQSVESSYRGFALTGDPSYLDSYHSNISIAQEYLGIIRDLTVDNPEQQQRIPVFEKLIARKIQFGGTVNALRQTKGLEAAAESIGSGEGQRIMDEFEAVIRDFEGEETRLLVLREANTKRRVRQTKVGLVLGTVLGLLIAAGSGWSVQRGQSARMLAEEARRESEERFRTLANNIPQLAWMANEKGYVFWYNDRWFDYTGTNLEQMRGWGWQKVHHPDHVKRVVEKITRCFQSGEVWEDTFPLRGRDGSYHLFLSRAVPVRDPSGKALRWVGTNTDISESESSGAKYRGLLEAAPDAMVVVNTDGEIVLLNVRAEKQFGYHRDELVGQKVTNIIPVGFAERLIADDLRSAADALAQQIGTGIELIARRKDGSEFPIEIMLSPLESAEGILVTAAIRDITTRRDAETHLAQMEGRYRGLLEAAPDAMVVVNQAGDIVLLNVQAEKQFGYSRDELVGQKVTNIIPEGFAERLIADDLRSAADALAQQIGTGIELIARRKDSTEFPIEIMLSPLESAEGILVTAAIRNITTRKDAEKHLAQMEGRYRGLLEAAPDAMVVVNTAGEIVLLNVQAEKQLGYSRDELIGQKVTNIIPEGFAERLIADDLRSAADALAQQIGTGIELIARRKDGTEFPIEIMLSPLESAEGILVTAAIRDISVRRSAEEHLAQMEGRYRGLLEAAPDAMVVVNKAGEIVLLNVQAENQFGYHRDELVGQKMTNIVPEGFAERLIADALRSSEDALAQQIGTGIELTGRRKNRSEFPIEMMLSPLESAEGILVTAAIRDISKRKMAEADLLHKVEELNRSNVELGQFAYIASHDLQEPLRMVASYTQLLSRRYKGKLDADADEFIAFAVDGAGRMQRLIQDLLAFSRVGTKGKDFLDISSEEALQRALINLRGAIEESGALITHDPLPAVLADEMQLVQLFQNLVGNAIKYQKPGTPRVHISAGKNGAKQWTFSVKDNGLGIDPQYFERIFGMFQRLHKREEFAGTGIGLAICKKIVERHGGTISVESKPGEGSTFRFALIESGARR